MLRAYARRRICVARQDASIEGTSFAALRMTNPLILINYPVNEIADSLYSGGLRESATIAEKKCFLSARHDRIS
jgi:hypothetical protein